MQLIICCMVGSFRQITPFLFQADLCRLLFQPNKNAFYLWDLLQNPINKRRLIFSGSSLYKVNSYPES
jgi:hypothetical protein